MIKELGIKVGRYAIGKDESGFYWYKIPGASKWIKQVEVGSEYHAEVLRAVERMKGPVPAKTGSRGPAKRVSESDLRKIREDYGSGMSTRALAKKYGVSFTTIQKYLKNE